MRRNQLGKSSAAWMVVTLVALVLLYRGCVSLVYNVEDQPKADAIVAAVTAYRAKHGRYPPNLDALAPGYVAELPLPRKMGFIEYIVDTTGSDCWVAFNTHRDYVREYTCRNRTWIDVEWNDRDPHTGTVGQRLKGPG